MTRYSLELAIFTSLILAVAGCQPYAQEHLDPADSELKGQASGQQFANLDYSSNLAEHHDVDGKVKVTISSAWKDDELVVVRGIFTPDNLDYHLYGSNLPKEGVEGIGRPTLIEVVDEGVFGEIGSLVSDKPSHDMYDETLNISLSVYPKGPVTLYLPLRYVASPESATTISLKLTYMSCSSVNCNFPIVGAIEQITIPPPN